MKINPEIFKAYDIRGIYGKDFDDQMAYKLGQAYCVMRKKEVKKSKIKVVVGRDMRISSPQLKEKLTDGLIDGGADVIDINLSSTPTFYFAVAKFGYDGGILVSASHNPKEYNGFKIVRNRALPVGKNSGMAELKKLVIENNFAKISKKGVVKKDLSILKKEVVYDLDYVGNFKIKSFKIVIDSANAMGSLYFDELFKYLNCEIIRMNWDLDGTFPAHEADPFRPENVNDLKKRVKEEQADLGIATDGDGDRIFFVDNDGKMVEPGITRAILCQLFLERNPGAKIVYDIRPGKITPDIIKENGGEAIYAPVGHSLIKEKAVEVGAVFAGESSGHFFVATDHGIYESPVIVTLLILQMLSKNKISLAEYIKPYQRYFHSGEINSTVEDVQGKIQAIKEKYNDGKQNDLDGISVKYRNWWFNVRGSNTEPKIRLNLEAVDKKIMEEKRDELLAVIRNCLKPSVSAPISLFLLQIVQIFVSIS